MDDILDIMITSNFQYVGERIINDIIEVLSPHYTLTTRDIADFTGYARSYVNIACHMLEDTGKIQRAQTTKTTKTMHKCNFWKLTNDNTQKVVETGNKLIMRHATRTDIDIMILSRAVAGTLRQMDYLQSDYSNLLRDIRRASMTQDEYHDDVRRELYTSRLERMQKYRESNKIAKEARRESKRADALARWQEKFGKQVTSHYPPMEC